VCAGPVALLLLLLSTPRRLLLVMMRLLLVLLFFSIAPAAAATARIKPGCLGDMVGGHGHTAHFADYFESALMGPLGCSCLLYGSRSEPVPFPRQAASPPLSNPKGFVI
jgi:hypothetical protein